MDFEIWEEKNLKNGKWEKVAKKEVIKNGIKHNIEIKRVGRGFVEIIDGIHRIKPEKDINEWIEKNKRLL